MNIRAGAICALVLAAPLVVKSGAGAAELARSSGLAAVPGGAVPLTEALRIAERQALQRALQPVGGNRSAAARLLAVSRSTLYSSWGIRPLVSAVVL
jgi:DNA-binding NtrC family response regulator